MKKILAALLVVAALTMGAMAAQVPDWVEKLGPGQSYTAGSYWTMKGLAQDYFTPQILNSEFSFNDDYGFQGAEFEQHVYTNIGQGDHTVGVTRQYLQQTGSAFIFKDNCLEYDAEHSGAATPIIMGLTQSQSTGFSGLLDCDYKTYTASYKTDDKVWYDGASASVELGTGDKAKVTVELRDEYPYTGALSEISTFETSSVGLQKNEVMVPGIQGITSDWALSGSASMGAAFENAYVDNNDKVTIDFDTGSQYVPGYNNDIDGFVFDSYIWGPLA